MAPYAMRGARLYKPMPKWKWPRLVAAATYVSALIAIAVLIVPTLPDWDLRMRATVLLSLLVGPVILWITFYLLRRLCVLVTRALAYDELFAMLATAQGLLRDFRAGSPQLDAYPILHAALVQGQPVITVKRLPRRRLKAGDRLAVLDSADGYPFGVFTVIEDHGDRYRASACGDIDPLWYGDMVCVGSTQSDPPLHTLAIHVPPEDTSDD